MMNTIVNENLISFKELEQNIFSYWSIILEMVMRSGIIFMNFISLPTMNWKHLSTKNSKKMGLK